ncbi:site-specific DNA-methyltransferase [Patescibacteria group bacterium]|nr:site-specific DNA-methyltransferase [Patescibacteria group bacterium]
MSKYEKFSKEELMALVEKQDNELASKKYGLVWDSERELEQVVLDCEHNLPVLKRVKGKEIREPKNNEQEYNILIEGDNYHALTVLNYTHREKIDVIYIDPPYNTGNKSWKYNNNYVEPDDEYYHSKWLNMMEKRLNIAKKLLKKDGCLICAIDENEFANLYLLLNKIFSNYKIDQVVIVHNPRGVQGKNFSYIHEYAFFVYSNDGKQYIGKRKIEEKDIDWRGLRDNGGESLRTDAKNCFYPMIIEDGKIIGFDGIVDIKEHPRRQTIKKGNKFYVYPIDKEGIERKWRYARQSVEQIKHLLRVKKTAKGYEIEIGKDFGSYRTVWIDKKYDANENGSKLVKQITGVDFPYPKSIFTVKDCISTIIGNKKSALVLDFFAGSATTGHAVLELNKEDGGNRKFILCTNNEVNGIEKELREKGLSEKEIQEYGICRKITYSRLEKVIKGYKKNGNGEKVDGLGGNLQYFRTDLIKDTKNKDQMRIDLTEKCTEMLCVKENIFNFKIEKEDYKIFISNKGDKFLCVYYNLFDESFKEFLKEIKKLTGEKKIYMFSINGTTDKKLFASVKDCIIEEIPQKIIEIYKQLVKLNIPVKADTIFLEFEKANKKIFTDKEKDESARILRIVLEKTIQKIAQKNSISIFKDSHKEEKIAVLNDKLKEGKVFNKVQWEENKTYLAIGNNASHGDYSDYDIKQVENFYRHIQLLFNDFGI